MSNQSQSGVSAGEGAGPGGWLALVLAWLVPGLGHWMLGERARGLIFAIVIHGLFAAGMVIAGVRAINPPEQQIWTYTQYLSGWPMLIASPVSKAKMAELNALINAYQTPNNAVILNGKAIPRPPVEDDSKRAERIKAGKEMIDRYPLFANHPKVQDIGAVYCGIAGMLNLLVMFDVLLRITGSEREVPGAKNANAHAKTAAGGTA